MATQYYTASSIDGFIADQDNSLTWLFQFSEQTGIEDHYPRFIAQVGAMAMGSTTYEWVADHTGFLDLCPIRPRVRARLRQGLPAV